MHPCTRGLLIECVEHLAMQISMPEFVAATLGKSVATREDFIQSLFSKMDTDGDGEISQGAALP